MSDDEDVFNVMNDAKKDENIQLLTSSSKPKKVGRKKKEVVLVPMIEKPKQKRTRSEEAEKAMKERLAQLRIKAYEKRMENKKLREQQKQEEAEKVEKVNKYLKNDDLFEKKYADKFEKITDLITTVSNDVSEMKEYKKQKQLQKIEREKRQQAEKEAANKPTENKSDTLQTPTRMASVAPLTASQILSNVATTMEIPINKPQIFNYKKMTFGNKQKYF